MGCLNDIYCGKRTIIGIQDFVECANPESHLFINRLPGMDLKFASAIASEQYQTGAKLMQEKIKDSIKMVVNDFTDIIGSHFDFNAIIVSREVRQFSESTLPQEAKSKGLVIKRWRSEMAHIFIENLFVRVKVGGEATIRIIDGDITKSYSVSLTSEKINQVLINYKAESESIRIEMDNTNFDVYTGTMYKQGGCGSCGTKGSELYITGWDGDQESGMYYGIGVSASVRCYEENAICKLLPRMYFLIWYRSGIEILKEGIFGTRLNNIASMSKDKMKEMKAEYEAEYLKSLKVFEVNIMTYLRSLRQDCVTCNSNRYVSQHP